MADSIKEVVGGLAGGYVAGLIGYTTDLTIGTMFWAFQQIVPLFALVGVGYAVISFLLGIEEEYLAGVFFALGVVLAGASVSDSLTIVSGFISTIGILVSFVWKMKE